MSKVPILTIPESSYDPSTYSLSSNSQRRSRLLIYLVKLTHGSAIGLTLAYLLGLFVLKPLLETTANRRLELLEKFRHRLRDCYLNLIGRVSYIPIIAINKNDGSGKLYADAICQTDDSYLDTTCIKTAEDEEEEINKKDKLFQGRLLAKLTKLSDCLKNCHSYSTSEVPHYQVVNFSIKDFQNKADMIYFNNAELFSIDVSDGDNKRKKNLAVETRNEIRSIKGLYMSGQV